MAGSGTATYRVRTDDPAGPVNDTLEFSRPTLVCQCPREEKHHGTRGPCKHVLAVALSLRGTSG
ncbi:SWIM zinc finger family protein [Nocardioides sp. B-3]|uniref:SWIM zinc finger family protein n=1 Tax=Nocardioides sp. B-3 TaxID=2895565 RepID=UPI002152E7E3|nr:SWIM zinc finger family protein [Nocardioides sp. B-3]UUZ57969.1 SWIM zinc finger domain-containing protein [Nocardioides sp. B-3]